MEVHGQGRRCPHRRRRPDAGPGAFVLGSGGVVRTSDRSMPLGRPVAKLPSEEAKEHGALLQVWTWKSMA
jgi:hypothetical protein